MSPQPRDYIPEADGRDIMALPPCWYCKHLLSDGTLYSEERWTCKAYPEGIPWDVWAGESEHNVKGISQEGDFVYESKVVDNGEHGLQTRTWQGKWVNAK